MELQVFTALIVCFGYGGALLSQIGEFSFVLAAVGLRGGMIVRATYDLTIAVIFLTLLASPLWIMPFRRHFARSAPTETTAPCLAAG